MLIYLYIKQLFIVTIQGIPIYFLDLIALRMTETQVLPKTGDIWSFLML